MCEFLGLFLISFAGHSQNVSLKEIFSDTCHVIGQDIYYDKAENKLFFAKLSYRNMEEATICYIDLGNKKTEELFFCNTVEPVQFIKYAEGYLTFYFDRPNRKIVTLDVQTRKVVDSIISPALADIVDNTVYYKFFLSGKSLLLMAKGHGTIEFYQNILDSSNHKPIRLSGHKLLAFLAEKNDNISYVTMNTKKGDIFFKKTELSNQKNIFTQKLLTINPFDDMNESGMYRRKNGEYLIWFETKSFESVLLRYNPLNKTVNKFYLRGKILDVLESNTAQILLNIAYHSPKTYRLTLFEESGQDQNLSVTMTLDIWSGIYAIDSVHIDTKNGITFSF